MYQDSRIGQFVLYVSRVTQGAVLGIVFNISDKTIEFTSKDNTESSVSKHKLQYIAELLKQQTELATIHAMYTFTKMCT